uniref:Uncharacterized protein n=1 Tax=Populus davidiana TaxID=266767 RepID=A0A6M2EPL6_9ROSI
MNWCQQPETKKNRCFRFMYESHCEVPIGHLHEPLFAVINLVFFCSFPQKSISLEKRTQNTDGYSLPLLLEIRERGSGRRTSWNVFHLLYPYEYYGLFLTRYVFGTSKNYILSL